MAPTDGITARGGKFYVTVNGIERGFYSREMANRFIGHHGMRSAIANESLWTHNADLVNRQLGINTHGSASNPYYLRGAARQSYAMGYENFWQTALAEQDARLRASVTDADFTTHYGTVDELRAQAPLGDVTANPGNTPANPGNTPANPGNTPANPGNTPANPGNTPVNPGNTPVNPGNTPAGRAQKLKFFRDHEGYHIRTEQGVYKVDKATYEAAKRTGIFNPQQQALHQAHLAEQGARFRGTSQEAMRDLHRIGQDSENTKFYRELEKSQTKGKGFKIPKGLKKAGKWAAIGALVIGAAVGIGALIKGCSSDKKAEEGQPENTTPTVEETPATEAPVAETPAEQQPVEEVPAAEQPVAETPAEEPQNEIFQALKGSDYWKYAERELIAEHQGEADYKPTNSEINTRMYEILQRNNASIAADGIHSDPMLMVNDDIQLSRKLTDLLKQAKQQLIEEHQGQAGYEPTYSEVAKKMDEIISANK